MLSHAEFMGEVIGIFGAAIPDSFKSPSTEIESQQFLGIKIPQNEGGIALDSEFHQNNPSFLQ
jgi:hypothetical protein